MPLEPLLPLFLFILTATISPGGATTLATASGVNFGFRRSLPLIAGIAAGLGSMAALAAAGLATLFTEIPSLRLLMQAAGSLYLLWLAWQIARSGRPGPGKGMARPTSFIGGVGLLWVNPKGWAMTLSAAASFAGLAEETGRLAALLGFSFAILAIFSLTLWCVAGLLLGRLLRTDMQWRALNAVLGLLLVASIIPIWLE